MRLFSIGANLRMSVQKVVVITGGSSGIGLALAQRALSEGYHVAVCARQLEKLSVAFSQVPSSKIFLKAVDVRDADACNQFIASVVDRWKRIDVLINNAGVSMRALFADVQVSVLKELMDINFWGMVYCTKAALPTISQHKGVIVGISSIAGYRGLPARSGYSASKFAMQGFLESLRTELLHTGVHVMWVSPGFTASNIRNTARDASGMTQQETPLKETKLMSADTCARHIWRAIERRKRTLVLTSQGKFTVWLNKLWPALVDGLVFKHFLNEPGSPLRRVANEE